MNAALAHSMDPAFLTRQDWKSYTEEQHEVWSILYERRMSDLQRTGATSSSWSGAHRALG